MDSVKTSHSTPTTRVSVPPLAQIAQGTVSSHRASRIVTYRAQRGQSRNRAWSLHLSRACQVQVRIFPLALESTMQSPQRLTSFLRLGSPPSRSAIPETTDFLVRSLQLCHELTIGRLTTFCHQLHNPIYIFFPCDLCFELAEWAESVAAQVNGCHSITSCLLRPRPSLANEKTGSHPRLYSYNSPRQNRITNRAMSPGKDQNPRPSPHKRS